jgi:hypothetical protein
MRTLGMVEEFDCSLVGALGPNTFHNLHLPEDYLEDSWHLGSISTSKRWPFLGIMCGIF